MWRRGRGGGSGDGGEMGWGWFSKGGRDWVEGVGGVGEGGSGEVEVRAGGPLGMTSRVFGNQLRGWKCA